MEQFSRIARLYLHANSNDPVALKNWALVQPDHPTVVMFKKEFRSLLESKAMSKDEFDGIMSLDYDELEEYYDYLKAVWDYIYEEGPIP